MSKDLLSKIDQFETMSQDPWYQSKSNISGKGAYAKHDLDKNKLVGLAFEKVRDTGDPDKDYKRTDLGALVNHSSTPNLILFSKKDKFYYRTLSKIDKDSELTIDYKDFPWEGKRDFE